MMLSPHFELEEFLRSETAARAGRDVTVDDPTIMDNLRAWCAQIGEPLRQLLGKPIMILSGYRPPWLNAAVGGASDSAHLYGRAADILVPEMTVTEVCLAVTGSSLPYDQVIAEFGRWTHVAIAAGGAEARHEPLTSSVIDGHTVYRQGIQVA